MEDHKFNNNNTTEGHQIDFYYMAGVLYRYWILIFSFTFVTAVLSIIYVLVATPVYMSTVTLYPMNQDEGGPLKQLAVTLGISNKTSGYYILDVLNSRRIGREVIYKKYWVESKKDSMNLLKFWELDEIDISDNRKFEQALRNLRGLVTLREDKETSLVSVQVEMTDKVLAKEVADQYCESTINYLNNEMRNSIRETIKFTELRLIDVTKKLRDIENDLVGFQNNNVRTNSPALTMDLKRKYQEVELMQGVVVLLEKQLELLKIEEVKEKTVINILDIPEVHDKPLKPQKRRIVMVNTIIGFLLAFVGVIMKEKAVKYKLKDKFLSEMIKPVK